MSALHLRQIKQHLEQDYTTHIDMTGAEQQHHQLSRAVAALALEHRTGLVTSTACKSVTDHTGDGGIDAIGYAADRSTLVFIQSKWTETANGINQGDVLKFAHGVERVINNQWDEFSGPILNRRSEIEDILSQPGTRIELVVATTSTADLGPAQQQVLDGLCEKMNDSTDIASAVYFNQGRIYSIVAATDATEVELRVNLRNWGSYAEAGYVSYYGTAAAQEVVSWYRDHADLLFSRNIRGALVGTEVNSAIASTAQEDPGRFWFFNNGITVIARSFDQTPAVNQKVGTFLFHQASVVNGAQTVSSLAHAADASPELLESADVFLRFVTVEDPDGEFGRLVTRRTNTQNRVGEREFVALDPEQERIRLEFSVSGYRYAYRSGETVADHDRGCDLTEATIALACLAGMNEAVLAKREISRLWDDVTKAPYKSIFNAAVSATAVWAAVTLMRRVDYRLDELRTCHEGRDRLVVIHGNRLILCAVMKYLDYAKIAKTLGFDLVVDADKVAEIVDVAVEELVSVVNQRFPDSYPQPLFKNRSKCVTIGDAVVENLQARTLPVEDIVT